jgi:hypothetical protein
VSIVIAATEKAGIMPKSSHQEKGFEVYMQGEELDAKCKSCGDIPRLEYLGFDPIYPFFKVICDRCGTWTTMKIRLICHGLNRIPQRYQWDTEAAITQAAEHTRRYRETKGRMP